MEHISSSRMPEGTCFQRFQGFRPAQARPAFNWLQEHSEEAQTEEVGMGSDFEHGIFMTDMIQQRCSEIFIECIDSTIFQ